MTDAEDSPSAPSGRSPGRWWWRPRVWLALFVVVYFAFSFYSGIVSYYDFQTQNSTDAGIITQAFASTVHGHVPPFYESYDCLVKARCSFLLVHPSFVLYAAVPFYAAWPSTITLFGLRAAVVALTGVPLYALTRRVTGSAGKGLLAVGLLYLWAPGFSADTFSLHTETFLPIGLLTLAYLWETRRFRWGALVAVFTFLSIEVAPIFVFFLGLFFLYPTLKSVVRSGSTSSGSNRHRLRKSLRGLLDRSVAALHVLEVRWTVGLMLASVAAFVALSLFTNWFGYALLGTFAPPGHPGLTGLFHDNSGPATQSLATVFTSGQSVATAEYWLLLIALLGCIPLLVPRAWLLIVPWMGWTFLTVSNRYTTMGHQYSWVAGAGLLVALAYGLREVPLESFRRGHREPRADVVPPSGRAPAAGRWPRASASGNRLLWGSALAVVLVANAVLLPVNPLLANSGLDRTDLFEPDYFDHSLTIDPGFGNVEALVATVPRGATIVAPSVLFPVIANYPRAYVLAPGWENATGNLPFNASVFPQYVLVSSTSLGSLGKVLEPALENRSAYGMSAYVASTGAGLLMLFEKGFSGNVRAYGPPAAVGGFNATPTSGLRPAADGTWLENATSPTGSVIQSAVAGKVGHVWTGPRVAIGSGNFTVTLDVRLTAGNGTLNPAATVLRLEVGGFPTQVLNVTVPESDLSLDNWTELTFEFASPNPVVFLNADGFLEDPKATVQVASVSVEPTA